MVIELRDALGAAAAVFVQTSGFVIYFSNLEKL